MISPLVSVVMPVYNAEEYLNESIESILNQTFTDFEFIIINDGSSDGSEAIIFSYDDKRIRYIKNESNLKISHALNKGITLAKGQYIARMDADDISYSERFELQVMFMTTNPDVGVCGTWLETFGARDEVWEYPVSHEEIKAKLLLNSALAHPSVFVKKSVFDNATYLTKNNGAEDYCLWTELIDTTKFRNIPMVLLKYRFHSQQTDKAQQISLSNKIRKKMLNRMGCGLSENELSVFFDISNNKPVSVSSADTVLNKISIANKEFKYFDQEALIRLLGLRFLRVVNSQASVGFSTWFGYQQSFMRKKVSYSIFGQFKLFIKCLLRYSHG